MGLIAADESDSVVLYSEGAMSFRFKKSGQRTYIQIVENKRVDGAVRQSVIANLGRADELAASGALASLLATGAKLTDQVLLINALDEDADGALSVSAKRIGGPLLFDKIWDRLGVADVLGDLLKDRAFEFAVERAVFVSTLHRIFASGSDRDCASWMEDYDIPGAEGLDLHHFYRAMAWLGEEMEEKSEDALAPRCVAVSREHRRAKTDRLDTELLMRAFLGWLRGERRHCSMAAIPTIEEEDAKRPNREHEKLVGDRTRIVNRMKSTLARFGIRGFKPTLRKADEKLSELRTAEGTLLPENTCAELRRDMTRLRIVREQLKEIEQQRLRKLEAAAPAKKGPHAMVGLIARVIGIGIETADMLVNEILSRHLRDSKAVARYAGLTGSPDESGKRRREKGLACAGNARVRRGMIQLAWRFLRFQKDSVLAQWFRARAADGRSGTRKTMIVALARKLLVALWRMTTTGEIPEGVILRVV